MGHKASRVYLWYFTNMGKKIELRMLFPDTQRNILCWFSPSPPFFHNCSLICTNSLPLILWEFLESWKAKQINPWLLILFSLTVYCFFRARFSYLTLRIFASQNHSWITWYSSCRTFQNQSDFGSHFGLLLLTWSIFWCQVLGCFVHHL